MTSIINNYVDLECFNRIPKIYKDANCHQSRAIGISASLVIIDSIDQYISKTSKWSQHPYQIRLMCDNKSVVKNKMKNNKLTLKQHYSPNIDVLRSVMVKLMALKLKRCNVLIVHIKGHQDKRKTSVSTDEIMNKKNMKAFLLPADRCQILIDNKQVCSKYTKKSERKLSL
jgi:hypothetical protein